MQNNKDITADGLLLQYWTVRALSDSVNQFATSLTATEIQLPHGITQCYLQPGRGDILTFTQPIKAGTQRDARLSWLSYTPRWYTSPKTVTHPVLTGLDIE